ncbi:MAG: glycosyltransferase, partial [Pseudothermotoga sp.]
MEVVQLFDLPITISERHELLELLIDRICSRKKTFVVTANASIVVKTVEDPLYRKAVQRAD